MKGFAIEYCTFIVPIIVLRVCSCTNVMLGSIAAWSVCAYHAASKKVCNLHIKEII